MRSETCGENGKNKSTITMTHADADCRLPIVIVPSRLTELRRCQRFGVVIAKPGLDGHDRGAKVIARALRDAGMEVIYTGLRQTPEQIVSAALQEDADVIGLSILSGAHNHICPRVMELLRAQGLDDVLVVVGGIIPDVDIPTLKEIGVKGIFLPGTPMQEIVEFIQGNVREERERDHVRSAKCEMRSTNRRRWAVRTLHPVPPQHHAFCTLHLRSPILPTMAHRLLLADDSVTIQRVIELTFAEEGVDVVSVGDGAQAIARLGAETVRHRARRCRHAGQGRLRGRRVCQVASRSGRHPRGAAHRRL